MQRLNNAQQIDLLVHAITARRATILMSMVVYSCKLDVLNLMWNSRDFWMGVHGSSNL